MKKRKPLREYLATTRDETTRKLRTDSVWAETSGQAARERVATQTNPQLVAGRATYRKIVTSLVELRQVALGEDILKRNFD